MSSKSINALHGVYQQRSAGPFGHLDVLQAVRGSCLTHVAKDVADTDLLTSNGTTVNSTTYQIDVSAGDVVMSGEVFSLATQDDQDLLADITSYTLAGGAAAAIADGNSVDIALVCIVISGALALRGVFGAEATTGSESLPTGAQVYDALRAANPTGWDGRPGLIIGRINAARSGAAVTFTHADPATNVDNIKSEREHGTVF